MMKKTKPSPPGDKSKGSPMQPELPVDEHEEQLIDEALVETFPASDPISIPAPEDQTDADDDDSSGKGRGKRGR